MNRIAFVFTHGPHGSAAGREGLDALLTTSAITDGIGAFFVSDGVLLLLRKQQPEKILARDFVSTFGILSLYDINRLYLCEDSAAERGLGVGVELVLDLERLPAADWFRHLTAYDVVLTF